LKPSEFWAASTEDKLYMTAYMLSTYEMRAVENYEMEKKMEQAQRQNGRR
jgi:hypothetical protein